MYIFPGELLHSYLLRVLKSSGNLNKSSNLQGIVSTKGNWISYPNVSNEHRHLFSHITKKQQLDLVECHTQAHRVKLTSSASAFADLSEQIFCGGNHSARLDRIPIDTYKYKESIRYCKYCFGEQLYLYGISWFALEWLDEKRCSRHLTPLESIGCDKCSKQPLINKVISTFNGTCIDCDNQIWSPVDLSQTFGEFSLNKRPPDILSFSPCVFWEFVTFLKLKYKRLLKIKKQKEDFEIVTKLKSGLIEQEVFDLINQDNEIDLIAQPLTEKEELDFGLLDDYPKVIYKNGIHKEFNFEQSVRLFSSLLENQPRLIEEFYSNSVQKTLVRLRFPFNHCVKEIAKASNVECMYCHMSYSECAGSLYIARERLDPFSDRGKPYWCEMAMKKNRELL